MQHSELVKRFEEMLSGGPGVFFDADEYEIIIDYYITTNQYQNAIKAIEYALQQYPFSIEFMIRKAQILSVGKETKKAFDLLSQAETISPHHPEIFMTRGSIYSLTGLPEKAIENYKKAIEYAEGDAGDLIEDAYLHLAFEHENLEEFDDSIFYLKKAIAINPTN